ncbi:uncharacterized protein MONBRDRAFT_9985 [Monosiga brevicollis MX1]|uniref:EGF-like domain-containing protein n=1 Tax=Monosiga brevicollis TaxID=81824 RepID=A9V4U5_MONBE|nr:uncharacterized protein MONBRDRAFT_9985 [Monosiga brevicollis MX1]EDQ87517.1 predicted protein [Monosiga brevicollis MX1]|eukprot:XP_001747777.1 hypothetical protein [Monosiga brevicollis MX1]
MPRDTLQCTHDTLLIIIVWTSLRHGQDYRCDNCPPTFTGKSCNNDVDECTALAEPCSGHGSCTNTWGGYQCTCDLGYTGTTCANSYCDQHACQNGATCVLASQGYTCTCPEDYVGTMCEQHVATTTTTTTTTARHTSPTLSSTSVVSPSATTLTTAAPTTSVAATTVPSSSVATTFGVSTTDSSLPTTEPIVTTTTSTTTTNRPTAAPCGAPCAALRFQRSNVDDVSGGAGAVEMVDMNADGLVDILSAAAFDASILWYANLGGRAVTRPLTVSQSAPGVLDARALFRTDHAWPDVVSASLVTGNVALYPRLNATTFGAPTVIQSGIPGASSLTPVDLNEDGRTDLVVTDFQSGNMTWYLRQESGALSAVAHSSTGLGPLGAVEVKLLSDTRIQLVHCNVLDSSIQLSLFDSANFSVTTENLIQGHTGAAAVVRVGDVDGDGLPDLVTGNYDNNSITWYRQGAAHQFEDPRVLAELVYGVMDLDLADVDDDGDLDVVSASNNANTVAVFLNLGGTAGFTAPFLLDTNAEGVEGVRFMDFDKDGSLDVVASCREAEVIAIYWNLAHDNATTSSSFAPNGTLPYWIDLTVTTNASISAVELQALLQQLLVDRLPDGVSPRSVSVTLIDDGDGRRRRSEVNQVERTFDLRFALYDTVNGAYVSAADAHVDTATLLTDLRRAIWTVSNGGKEPWSSSTVPFMATGTNPVGNGGGSGESSGTSKQEVALIAGLVAAMVCGVLLITLVIIMVQRKRVQPAQQPVTSPGLDWGARHGDSSLSGKGMLIDNPMYKLSASSRSSEPQLSAVTIAPDNGYLEPFVHNIGSYAEPMVAEQPPEYSYADVEATATATAPRVYYSAPEDPTTMGEYMVPGVDQANDMPPLITSDTTKTGALYASAKPSGSTVVSRARLPGRQQRRSSHLYGATMHMDAGQDYELPGTTRLIGWHVKVFKARRDV